MIPDHLHTGAIPVMGAQSGFERMPPTCAVRGIALLVVICSGLMEVYCVAGNVVVVSAVLLTEWGWIFGRWFAVRAGWPCLR